MMPTLNSKRLILKPLLKVTQRHLDWLTDPMTMQFSEQRHARHNIQSIGRYLLSFRGRSCIWSINIAENGRHIGNITATADENNNVAEVGILIGDRDEWEKGYAKEAWMAVSEWLLDKEGGAFRKLEAGCRADHVVMKKVLVACGFKFEGERHLHFLVGSHPVGMVLYGRFK